MNTFVKHWREGLQELGYSEDEVTIKIVRAPESPIGWGIIFSSPDRETMEHIAELYAAYEEWTEDEDDDDPE